MTKKRALISWSGGKDSCLALQKAVENDIKIVALVSVMDEEESFTKSNGVSKEILTEQAKQLNLPLVTVSTSWEQYEKNLLQTLIEAKKRYLADCCVFGDIDIEAHRKFEEDISKKAGLKAILPLWGQERKKLAYKIIESKIKAKISVIRTSVMSEKYLGAEYTEKIFPYLIKNNIDLLGENGEFHSLVYSSYLFKKEIPLSKNRIYSVKDCKAIIFNIKKSKN